MRLITLTYATLALLWANAAAAAGVTLEYGVICELSSQGERSAPETELGRINLINQDRRFDVVTTQIPAQLGLSFGIRAEFTDETPPQRIEISVSHPPMGQNQVIEQRWGAALNPDRPSLNVFSFEYPHELVPGLWEFRILQDGATIAQQQFDVLNQPSTREIDQICSGNAVMS